MIYLILIINIAEIILAIVLIRKLLKTDKKIVEMNNTLLENKYKIKLFAKKMQEYAQTLHHFVKTKIQSAKEKQRTIVLNIAKNIITGVLVMTLPKKWKKKLIALELIGLIISTYKKQLKT